MKLKNKRLIKPKLTEMLDKALKHYAKNCITKSKDDDRLFRNTIIKAIIKRIFEIIENTAMHRSLPELNMYFAFCEWIAPHLTDYYNAEFWDKDTVHLLFKSIRKVSSIAFDSMKEQEFNDYFKAIQLWCATYIFETSVIKMMEEFENATSI